MDTFMTIVCSVMGSGGLFAMIQFFVSRHDSKNKRLDNIEEKLGNIEDKLKGSEMDNIRTQMLLMMSDYPEESSEIMKLAKKYFDDLGGDWYMTTVFNKWLTKTGVAKPEWFDASK